jgi:hypothetical protein
LERHPPSLDRSGVKRSLCGLRATSGMTRSRGAQHPKNRRKFAHVALAQQC